MHKTFKLSKEPSKGFVSKMLKPEELVKIKAFASETNLCVKAKKCEAAPLPRT